MRECEKYKNGYTIVPEYVTKAMQGLVYWIKYKKCFYNYYSMSEHTIVAEFASLLQSGAGENEMVLCERQYCNFFNDKNIPNDVNKERMDLTIVELENRKEEACEILADENKQKNGFLIGKTKIVIEVKLQSSSKKLVKEDFEWLKKVKAANENIAAFLLLVSENGMPAEYVEGCSGHGKKDRDLKNKGCYRGLKIHVSAVRFALNQKFDASNLKSWVVQTLEADEDDAVDDIKEQIDFIGEKMLSAGSYACLIEVV